DHRHVGPIIDDEGHPGGAAERSDLPRRLHDPAGRLFLHPELHGGGAPADRRLGDLDVGPPPRGARIGEDVDAPVADHPTVTRARRSTAGPSSASRASISAARNVPGPAARPAATSAATSKHTSPAPARPARAAIAPALPRTHRHRTSARMRRLCADRNRVAPAPTGSRMTGTPRALAARPASTMTSTASAVSVPMFRTSAAACAAIS